MDRTRESATHPTAVSAEPLSLFTPQAVELSEGARIQQAAMERRMIAAEVVALMREEGLAYQPIRKPLKRLSQDGSRRAWITVREARLIGLAWVPVIGWMAARVMGWL